MKKIQILGLGCPKCQKLYDLAEEAAKELGIEYEMEKVDDINRIFDMGAMTTPALAIDGDIKFSGNIPNTEELKKIIAK
ncbi:MAG: TM0996/MTH895 family glutaredoxin-like protein [Elusimicrobiales bacterium]|nr:TM0996/MTH895 family glutaredoxin-like protein [Elusimicrobiales bacterium]MCK5358877.1 TM0996/MTH895 family glutaredoxin-like protein [Elusimicrobiales bacterium]MCK5582412.1 TM0996/MTH895 family glutaredoxin-like protein [Elusimicrobiales bacterium]